MDYFQTAKCFTRGISRRKLTFAVLILEQGITASITSHLSLLSLEQGHL